MHWYCNGQLVRCAIVWLALMATGAAFANSKISPDLLPLLANPSNSVNVIVHYNSPPPTCNGDGPVGGLVCTAGNLLGGVVHIVFSLINAVSATVQAGDVIALSNHSNVSYISLDRPLNATLDYTAAAVNAPVAWTPDGTGRAWVPAKLYRRCAI